MFRCMYMSINYFFYAALQSRFSCTCVCIDRCRWFSLLFIEFCLFLKVFHKFSVITQLIKVSNFSEHFQAYVVDAELESYTIV